MAETNRSQSELNQILGRLHAMREATDSDHQVRRFDIYGVEVLQVSYDQTEQLWTITEHRQTRRFQFDDIDLVAIEIYDLLQDVQLTF